jgi:putative nucleotidyltransferase with HDIG domain
MVWRRLRVNEVEQRKGNIIGYITHDVSDKFGRLLLAEGTPITDSVSRKLEERGLVYRLSSTPLGNRRSKTIGLKRLNAKPFKVPVKLDKKFDRVDGEALGHASKYLNILLRQIQEDKFFSNNIKVLSQGHKATYSHSINVSLITVAMAQKLNFTLPALQKIALGSLFHDIGKILLPKSILNELGSVCDEQSLIYQQHTELGADLLAAEYLPAEIYLIALHHHEKLSGNGYPNQLKESDIHLNAAIVSVADTFDRLTSSIFHKNVCSPDEAIHEILSAKGIDFHPQAVDAFMELFQGNDLRETL